MGIKYIHDSCVTQNVDAIVNAANKNLVAGSGICGAIFSMAGYDELTNACNKITTPLKDGEAVITPSFNINNTKYIIHAVGPNFSITPNAFDILRDAYYNSLDLLRDNNLHSIAFPLISSGIYGGNLEYPAKVSAKECLNAYKLFTSKYPDYLIDVTLCCYSEKEYLEVNSIWEEYNGK